MKTLIAYSSKYGGTLECARRIQQRLPDGATLLDLDTADAVDLTSYDCVVVGSSIYMGKPRKAAKRFAKKQADSLLQKRLGLFLCCIQDVEKNVLQQFELAFPTPLLRHASAMEQLGGVVNFPKLGKVDGYIMNMIAGDLRKKTNSDVISTLSDERIDHFVKQLTETPDKA